MSELTIQNVQESREKEVTKTGNGAHVLVPKDWLGETVKVVRYTQEKDR